MFTRRSVKLKRKLTCSILAISLLCFAFMLGINAAENEVIYECNNGLIDIGYRPNVPEIDEDISGGALDLPPSYDPRKTSGATKVKNQFNNGTCWAFATNAILESKIYKETGLKEDLSEEALRYVQSNFTEKYLNYSPDLGIYLRNPYDGGSGAAGIEYISQRNNAISNDLSWISPNTTNDIPYMKFIGTENNNNMSWPEKLDSSYATNYAKNIKYINFDNVKQEIYNNGGVFLSININGIYVNVNNGAINNLDEDGGAHAVAILGWDDNYPKENFLNTCQPKNDGAFLIKNSYGIGWGDGGFGWVSYEDVSLNAVSASYVIKDIAPVSKNEYTLSYDYLPITAEVTESKVEMKRSITKAEPYVCMSNVYDVSELADEYGEINKITFYARNIGDFYKIYIVPLDGEKIKLPKISSLSSELAFGTVNYEGYTTVDLKTPYKFAKNTEKLAVIVKFNKEYVDGSDKNHITLCRERLLEDHYNPLTYANESFVYCNGEWTDISGGETSNCGNYCIRPTLVRRNEITQNSTLSTNEVRYKGEDISVKLNLNGNLLYLIKNNGAAILYEDADFTRSGNTVTLKKSFLEGLRTDIVSNVVFNFTDGDAQTLKILPKAKITNVDIQGKTYINETLTTIVSSDAGGIYYNDVEYQWQSSSDGVNWKNIAGATNRNYVLTKTDVLKYIRVVVSSQNSTSLQQNRFYSSPAETRAVCYGDTDLDGSISIYDVTEIQKIISGLKDSTREKLLAGDVDCDDNLTINDATYIQKYLAGLYDSLPIR